MSQQMPDSVWSAIQMGLTAGGGAALLKIVEQIFKQRDRRDDDAVSIRKELREQVAVLQKRMTALEASYDAERDLNATLFAEKEALRAENHRIRGENHELRSFLTQIVLHAQRLHQTLRLPDADMPRVPAWLNESSEGPTTGPREGGES